MIGKIIKRDDSLVEFDGFKIENAILAAAREAGEEISQDFLLGVKNIVIGQLESGGNVVRGIPLSGRSSSEVRSHGSVAR